MSAHIPQPRPRRLAVLVLLAVFIFGCGPDLPIEPLEDVPFPELAAAESEVREQLETARRDLEASLGSDQPAADLAVAFGSLGELYHGYDLAEAAMASYRNAHRLAPGDARWKHLLGILQRLEGELEGAAASFASVLDSEPDDLAATLHLAEVQLEAGDFPASEELARKALTLDSESAAAHQILGRTASATDNHAAAAASFERALELAPSATRLHFLAAQAHRKAGDLDAARGHLERQQELQAQGQGPGDVTFADRRLASVYTSLAGSAALMQRAAKAEVAGQLEASVEIYRQAVASDPTSPEARRDLGALLARVNRHQEAADQYREAVRLEPERGLNHFVLALVLEAAGEGKDSLDSMRRAVEAEPEYREFRLALAGRLARLGSLEEALGHFDHVLEGQPGLTRPRLERAKLRLELRDIAGAEDDARQVLAADAADELRAEALAVQGAVAARGGDRGKADALLRQALELDEDLAVAHFELANLAGIAGDFTQAAALYRKVTGLEPQRVAAWLGEATALALSGDEVGAVSRLEAGAQALPEAGVLRFTLARLLLSSQNPQVRNPERAVDLAEQLLASSRTPEHADLLVQGLAVTGRLDAAVRLQKQLIDAIPAGADPQLRQAWNQRLAEMERARSGR